jgi:hypothetical protein
MVALSRAKRRLTSATGDVRDRVGPALGDARDKAGPVLEETRDRITPVLEDARNVLAPVAQQAIAGSRRRGRRAAVRLGLAEEPKQSHRFRNLLILVGLSGAGFLAYKKFFSGGESWSEADAGTTNGGSRGPVAGSHSASTPSASAASTGSAPAPAPAPASGSTSKTTSAPKAKPRRNNETAPTAPLASEETVESHEPTTPDEPLEENKID